MSIFFVCRRPTTKLYDPIGHPALAGETTANEKHPLDRRATIAKGLRLGIITEGADFFCPSSSPNGQKEKVTPCASVVKYFPENTLL